MTRFVPLWITLAAMSASLFLIEVAAGTAFATEPTHDSIKITAGPDPEIVNQSLAIIRWTTTNPGGTDLHYGIVHFGTDRKHLSRVARSPNRRNPSHAEMIFRVRIAGLRPQTAYYYTVESTGATGVKDVVPSPIRTFKTK